MQVLYGKQINNASFFFLFCFPSLSKKKERNPSKERKQRKERDGFRLTERLRACHLSPKQTNEEASNVFRQQDQKQKGLLLFLVSQILIGCIDIFRQ